MHHLNYLLYILTIGFGQIKPNLIQSLQEYLKNFQPQGGQVEILTLTKNLGASPEQIEKMQQLLIEKTSGQYLQKLALHDISAVNLFEPHYPTLLKEIPDPPLILYYQGDLKILGKKCVAIVGSRKATGYGLMVVEKICQDIAGLSINTISGLAFGIDAQCHASSLKNNVPTIAVLGSSIDEASIYPKANALLAKQILNSGGLICSEYPPETPPMKHQFIARNRIIAALAESTIVVEAAKKSGALITADFALDYNRQLFAVPGSIFSKSSIGTNNLIEQGATVLTEANDLLFAMGIDPPKTKPNKLELTKIQGAVLKCIQQEAQPFEKLTAHLLIDAGQLTGILTELELLGLVKQTSPQVYESVA